MTKAHIDFPEVKDSLRSGRLKADGVVLKSDGQTLVTKAAIEPVWFLPGKLIFLIVLEIKFAIAIQTVIISCYYLLILYLIFISINKFKLNVF